MHDVGSFEVDGRGFFFKHDYYDTKMEYGSANPADPKVTTRVRTLILASDY
jgi:hypothetical protein